MAAPLNAAASPSWSEVAANWRRPAGQPVVDVVIPAYGAPDLLAACLRSVYAAEQRTPYQVVVIDDASPDERVPELLTELAALGLLQWQRNEVNRGFPTTCNVGMAVHPDRDIVLLNTDTEVHHDWLDRLCRAAEPDRVFTVTPLTNNGEIASYPVFLRDNADALELSDSELDLLARDVNAGMTVEVPTGVGFCMFLKRRCLDEIGGFDVEAFGRGYGEENDLCQRAIARGWTNLIATDVFVRHHGGQTFGAEKLARIEAAMQTLARLHPDYHASVGRFIDADPMQPAREALDAARVKRRNGGRAYLMVTHSRGGGTERHVQELRALLEADGTAVLTCRSDLYDPRRFRLDDPELGPLPNLPVLDLAGEPARLGELLPRLGVAHAHVHNLADFDLTAPDHLLLAFRHAGITFDVTVHDYQAVCPRINLVDATGVYCAEPSVDTCQRCVDLLGSDFGRPTVWSWRQRYEQLLRSARRVFAPSTDAARRMNRYLPGLDITVRPHPEVVPVARESAGDLRLAVVPRDRSRLRIGILGAISPPKGATLILEVARRALATGADVEFVVLGVLSTRRRLPTNVSVSGTYDEAELDSLIEAAELDVIWFPAVWPETYCYTLSTALRHRHPIVAFDLGAIAERLGAEHRGHVLPMGAMLDADRVLAELLDVARDARRGPSPTAAPTPAATYPDPRRSYYGF